MSKRIIYGMTFWVLVGLLLPISAWAADNPVGVSYRGHIQNIGDYPSDGSWVESPTIIGTVGQSKRIEGFEIKLSGGVPEGMEIRYNVHVQNKGWLYDENDLADWPKDGAYAGTRGESLRIEAVKIMLTDANGQTVPGYSVLYRGHVQNVGNLPADDSQWLKDGDQLGTVGSSLRLEALLVKVVQTETDLKDYNALLATVKKLNSADYTAASWTALQTALADHLVTAADSQEQVNTAVKQIQAAVEGLVKKAPSTTYDKAGIYGPANGTETITGDVTVAADGVKLQNLKIDGDLTIAESVGNGTVTLNNVTVAGDTFVRGGGVNSIHINGGQYSRIVMEKTATGQVRIVATDAAGLSVVIAEDASGESIILEGAFASVVVNAPNMTITTQGNTTTIGQLTVGVVGAGSTVTVNAGTTVTDLVLASNADIKGQGTVVKADVKADGVRFYDKAPGAYVVETGVVVPPVFPTPDSGGSGGGYYPPAPVAVTGVSLDQATLSVGVLRSALLTATVAPANASNKAVSWTSSDPTIATVDANGTVHGVKEGTASITVKTADGDKTQSCLVTVTTSYNVTDIGNGNGKITKMNGSSTDITIPETIDGLTITAIGDRAFQSSNIEKVTIPKTVKTIGAYAFENCKALSTVTFAAGSSLETIGDSAFYMADQIDSITIPKSVTAIGTNAFSTCSKVNTMTFEPDSKLKTIGARAFAGIGVTTLLLPDSVTTIGTAAFFDCPHLTTITIPAGVTAIGRDAFGFFGNVSISRSYTFRGNVPTTMGDEAGTINPEAVIPVSLMPTIFYYGNYSGFTAPAWSGYTDKKVILAAPTQTAPQITNSGSGTATVTLNWSSVAGANGYDVFVSNTAGSYGDASQTVAAGLTATTISGLDSSKIYYFVIKAKDAYGESLPSNEITADMNIAVTGVTVNPTTLTLIEGARTTLMANLEPTNAANKTVSWSSSNEEVATVDSTGKVTAVAAGTANITVKTTVGGKEATCAVTVKPIIETTTSGGGVTITKYNGTAAHVEIPAEIGGVPVTSIGAGAFSGNASLKTVTFAAGSQLSSIGAQAFSGCGNLTGVAIPESVTSIGANAFASSGLTSVAIPAEVTSIGADAFLNCGQLTTVSFAPDTTLTSIGAETFQGCRKLTAITLPDSVQTLGEAVFLQCVALPSINLDKVTTIGANAFWECTALVNLTIPNTVTSIGSQAFRCCTGLKVVNFAGGSNSQTLDGNTFWGCTALETVTFAADSKITAFGYGVFYGCSKLNSVTLPLGLTAISNNTFLNCTSLTTVSIPAKVNYIGESAFQGCTQLATLSFDSGSQLTTIAKNGFSGCPITSLALPAQLLIIGEKAFYNNQLSDTLIIPDKVTDIGANAFEGNPAGGSLTTLSILSPAATIGAGAFKNQPLTSIKIAYTDVAINSDSSTMGSYNTGFGAAYIAGGIGTYTYNAGTWIRTTP